VSGDEPGVSSDFHRVPVPAGVLVGGAALEPAAVVAFTEGPAAAADGTVYFSDIANNRILRFDPATRRFAVWREPSGRANGLLFDARGRLLACEGNEFGPDDGYRRVTRTDLASGRVEVLTDRFEGRRYNSPNDIAACSDGRVFFTDPCYGDRSTMELDHDSVYRIDPDGTVTRVLTQPHIQRPNGIAVSPDERTLYVVDSCPAAGGNRRIWAFDLAGGAGGRLSNQRLVFDFAPGRGGDGMALDSAGTLFIAAGIHRPRGPQETADVPPGIWVITPAGELRGRIPVNEDVVTNVTFGGDDLRTLYVTAGKTLLSVRVAVPGFVVHRKQLPNGDRHPGV
jgi:gluconolactonase